MLDNRLPVDFLDWLLWGLQAVVLILAWLQGRRTIPQTHALTRQSAILAVLGSWTWRLLYCFVLASTGFGYLVPDDVAKWLLSWGWAVSPYFVTWDGIWQGGTFYLHGMVMTAVQDPLVATKLVSAFYNLLPLVGIFALAQGLYRNLWLSSVTALAAAPWWLHVLLGTGTMTEMPVTGLMLSGLGLLLYALDERTEERRAGNALIGAALCFLAGTAFHLVAWMMLGAFLIAFAPRLLSTQSPALRRRLPAFLAVSFSYCVLWSLGCWIKFGSPLAFLTAYDVNHLKHGLSLPLATRAAAYPLAFLYVSWLVLPAIAIGALGAWSRGGEPHRSERRILAGVVLTLLVMTASAVVGSASNVLPVRSPVAIVAAVFPVAVARLAAAWPGGAVRARRRGLSLASLVAVGFLSVAWVVVNHERTFQRVRSQQTLDPDAVAMGAWLRETLAQPDGSGRVRNGKVVHVWVGGSAAYPDYSIAYLFGSPQRTILHSSRENAADVLSSVRRDEWLVTDRPVPSAGFEKIVEIGKYRAFRAAR